MQLKVRCAFSAPHPCPNAGTAHQQLYVRADALHCDISENNIMAHDPPHSKRRKGLLIDLDSALHVSGKHKVGPMGYTSVRIPALVAVADALVCV